MKWNNGLKRQSSRITKNLGAILNAPLKQTTGWRIHRRTRKDSMRESSAYLEARIQSCDAFAGAGDKMKGKELFNLLGNDFLKRRSLA